MRYIEGYEFAGLEIDSLTLIADLIYFDGPLLSHYESPQGDNYLFYWVDSDEECNRWMIIKVNLLLVRDYINKKITLLELIKERSDKSVYLYDFDHSLKVCRSIFTVIENLPEDYFPSQNSYYEFEPQDEVDLTALSRKYNQGIFELKITGEGVSYGTIPLEKLAAVLTGFEGIRSTLAPDYIKEKRILIKQQKETYKNKPKTKENIAALESLCAKEKILSLETSYDTIYRAAGSFRILFKPKNTQLLLWGDNYISDDFASQIICFLEAGEDIEALRNFTRQYNKSIVKKLENFIGEICKNKLNIGIRWCNDQVQQTLNYNIPLKLTSKILHNLSTFDYDDEEEIGMTGKFYAVDLKSGSYRFEGEFCKSKGKFASNIVSKVYSISFSKSYSIKVHRHFLRPIGKKEKIFDTLIDFTENKEEVLE